MRLAGAWVSARWRLEGTGEDGGERLTSRVKWNNQSGSDFQSLAVSLKG